MTQVPLAYAPLFSSELHLRWTTGGTVLDEAALATIDVIAPASATALFQAHTRRARGLHMHRRLPRGAVLELSSLSSEQALAWVTQTLGKSAAPTPSDRVCISWNEHEAVRTSWETFASYWPSFCREGQDDTIITPIEGAWILVYHHDGRFVLGG